MSALLRYLTVTEICCLKGKSYWNYYAMRRCLAEKKPVMWYRASVLFLFVEEGVYQSPTYFRSTELKKPV